MNLDIIIIIIIIISNSFTPKYPSGIIGGKISELLGVETVWTFPILFLLLFVRYMNE